MKDAAKVTAYEDELDVYLEKQSTIRSIIMGTIPEKVQIRIHSQKTVKELWEKLCSIYQDQNAVTRAHMLSQLHLIKTPEGGDPLKTIAEVLAKSNDYAAAGGNLDETDTAAILINAVPSKYHPVIQTVMTNAAMSKIELSVSLIITHLEAAIKLEQAKEERERSESQAMAAKWKQYKGQQQSNSSTQQASANADSDVECYNCGKTGHKKRDCWREGGGKAGQGPGQSSGNRKRKNKSKKGGNASNASTGQKDHAFAVVSPGTASKSSTEASTVVRLLDTAASHHYEPDKSNFIELKACEPYPIEIADGKVVNATEKGIIRFACQGANGIEFIRLSNVFYTPWMSTPLISVARLRENGVIFSNATPGGAILKDSKGALSLKIAEQDGVYPLVTWKPGAAHSANKASSVISMQEAHLRLGHTPYDAIKHLVKIGAVVGLEIDLNTPEKECQTCIEAKLTRSPIPKSYDGPRSTKAGEIVSSEP